MTAAFNFDEIRERRHTQSIKWSRGEENGSWSDYSLLPSDAPEEAEMLPMWLADMDFPTAPVIVDALRDRVDHGIFGYTGLNDEFYRAIEIWTARRHGWSVLPEWVTTNTGVMPAINLLIQSFTSPGDGVIAQSPVFHPILQSVTYNDRTLLDNALVYDGTRYQMDLSDLEAKVALTTTKMMILCNPHNPVGRVWSTAELEIVTDLCAAHEVLIVSDEIHGDLTYGWSQFTSVGNLTKHHDRLFVCTGPSKAFNLPGLKTSLTIIPDARLRERYRTTLRNQNELFGANLFGMTALTAAYRDGEPWLEALVEYLAGNVNYVAEFIATELPQLELVRPDALYLVWIDCRSLGLPGSDLDEKLRAAGVRVEQGATYGRGGEGFIRLTIACPRALLEEAMHRIRRAIAD